MGVKPSLVKLGGPSQQVNKKVVRSIWLLWIEFSVRKFLLGGVGGAKGPATAQFLLLEMRVSQGASRKPDDTIIFLVPQSVFR
jgi:hypothetical protein